MEKSESYIERPRAPQFFKYAGARAASVMIDRKLLNAALKHAEENNEPVIVPVEGALYRFSERFNEPLEKQYLIPHYERQGTREVRKEKSLKGTIKRFFGIAKKNISVARSCNEIDRELTDFINAYAAVQHERSFSLSMPYGKMNANERLLVERGSILVGHIINRMERTGQIILDAGDTKDQAALEDIKELILRWSDEPLEDLEALRSMRKAERDELRRSLAIKDFTYWSDIMTKQYAPKNEPIFRYMLNGEEKTFSGEELMRCVITHNELRDHDGALGYLAYEIRKIMNDELAIDKRERMAELNPNIAPMKPKEEAALHETVEKMTTDGIVTAIGFTCGAIDEAYTSLCELVDHKSFRDFIDRLRPKEHEIDETRHDISHYRGLLREYIDVARRRCAIDSKDAANFDHVALQFTHLGNELKWLHAEMRSALDSAPPDILGPSGKKPIREAIDLLDRGVTLINSMGEERIPRNRNAPEVYDKKLEQNKGRDLSSVGRLAAHIHTWATTRDQELKALQSRPPKHHYATKLSADFRDRVLSNPPSQPRHRA